MLNLILYLTSVILFVQKSSLSDIVSLVMIALSGVTLLVILIRFWWNPHPCDYFRYSFRGTTLAMSHYFVYIATLIASVVLLAIMPLVSFAPAVPLFLLIVFTLAYKPYQDVC